MERQTMPARPDHPALGVSYAALAHLAVGCVFALTYLMARVFSDISWLRPLGTYGVAIAGTWLLTLGLSQCVYLLPMAIYLSYTHRPRAAKGVLSCVGIVFLLCALWISLLVFGFNSKFVG